LRCWSPFSLAADGLFILAGLAAFVDLILAILVLLAVIKHFGVIRIRERLGPIPEQDDAPISPPEPPASIVKVEFVLIWTFPVKLVPSSRTASFGCKDD
jgi:hypothetical protein